jgi:hypothetical protein
MVATLGEWISTVTSETGRLPVGDPVLSLGLGQVVERAEREAQRPGNL